MPGTNIVDNDVTLLKAGVATGPNKGTAATWPTVAALASYTWSGADLAAFSASDFNAINFGVQISALNSSGGAPAAEVDYVQITITYTLPAGSAWLGGRQIKGSKFLP